VKIQNNFQLSASNTAYWRVWDAALWILVLTRSCGSLWLPSIREKISNFPHSRKRSQFKMPSVFSTECTLLWHHFKPGKSSAEYCKLATVCHELFSATWNGWTTLLLHAMFPSSGIHRRILHSQVWPLSQMARTPGRWLDISLPLDTASLNFLTVWWSQVQTPGLPHVRSDYSLLLWQIKRW
jgi:hypothetical protein